MSDRIEQLLEETNGLLRNLIEVMEQGVTPIRAGTSVGGGRGYSSNLGNDEKLALDDEVDIDWWFLSYGDEALPAKYMHAFSATGGDVNSLYTKDEGDYIFSRMKDYLGETNQQGTHVFTYLGKVWCKREKNARNCFGFVKKIGVTDNTKEQGNWNE